MSRFRRLMVVGNVKMWMRSYYPLGPNRNVRQAAAIAGLGRAIRVANNRRPRRGRIS